MAIPIYKLMGNKHMITFDFLMSFVSGTVIGTVGYRLYEQNGG